VTYGFKIRENVEFKIKARIKLIKIKRTTYSGLECRIQVEYKKNFSVCSSIICCDDNGRSDLSDNDRYTATTRDDVPTFPDTSTGINDFV